MSWFEHCPPAGATRPTSVGRPRPLDQKPRRNERRAGRYAEWAIPLLQISALSWASIACGAEAPPTDPCAEIGCGHGACVALALGGTRCVCEAGWSGLACERCASGSHEIDEGVCAPDERCAPDSCDRGGLCDDAGGTVICQCDMGYTGSRCESCAEGYHAEASWCAPDSHCGDADPCGLHGRCGDEGGVIRCTCDEGWAGERCQGCANGYHLTSSSNCEIDALCYNASCSGHGRCSISEGVIRCACDEGHSGPRCGFCDVGHHEDALGRCPTDRYCSDEPGVCGFHGACLDGGGAIACACDLGFDGPTCARCAPGYHAETSGACAPDLSCGANSCAGHGDCDESGVGVTCACDAGYSGPHCAACALGARRDPDTDACVARAPCPPEGCGAHGSCVSDLGCVCDLAYTGAACEGCARGYEETGGACEPATTCQPETCSGATAGTCDATTGVALCDCRAGYTGPNCELCALGFHRQADACAPDEACAVDTCAAGGACYLERGSARCACPPPAAGERCEGCAEGFHIDPELGACAVDEVCTPERCGDHGGCSVLDGVARCACDPGWAGERCKACATGYHYDGAGCAVDVFCAEDGSSCGEHGLCEQGARFITCVCDTGYAGPACEGCAEGYAADEGGACVATPDEGGGEEQ